MFRPIAVAQALPRLPSRTTGGRHDSHIRVETGARFFRARGGGDRGLRTHGRRPWAGRHHDHAAGGRGHRSDRVCDGGGGPVCAPRSEMKPAPAYPVTLFRVLIVDDESLMRWSLAQTLAAHGCDVVEAGDARSALAAIRTGRRRFDVVLLDYRLPDSQDLSLLAAIRACAPRTPVIMM